MRKQFRAPWDGLLIAMTSIIVLLLGGIAIYTDSLAATAINWTIIIGSALFGVYGYSIQEGQLRILRLGWSKDLNINEIKSIEYKPNAMLGSFRKWGIGGLFSYLGYFSNRILGSYKAYATHRKNTVLITTQDNHQIVVTPDDPLEFISMIGHAEE
jgi:hypothetical protein